MKPVGTALSAKCCAVRRQMYWCVWGASAPALEAAALWGGERRQLARHKLVYPGALALDRAARRLYWADAYLDALERARADGQQRRTLARPFPVRPSALTLTS